MGGLPNPAIRGTGIQASSASSYTVNWPAGTVAGDLAIVAIGHGFVANTPAGWTVVDTAAGTNWDAATFSKVLNSTDISTGHVIVTTTSSFDGVVGIVTFVGGTAGIREKTSQQNGSGSASITLNSSTAPLNTDTAIYFGSNRGASTDTVNRGTLRQQANDGSAASGCLYTEALNVNGTVSATITYGTPGSGNYQIIVIVRGV